MVSRNRLRSSFQEGYTTSGAAEALEDVFGTKSVINEDSYLWIMCSMRVLTETVVQTTMRMQEKKRMNQSRNWIPHDRFLRRSRWCRA